MSEQTERLQRLEAELPPLVQTWRWAPVVEAIQALQGVQCIAAVPLIADLEDLTRFAISFSPHQVVLERLTPAADKHQVPIVRNVVLRDPIG